MIETSTSVNHLNYEQPKSESMEDMDAADLLFYNSLKPELDALSRNPSEDTISNILAYSRKK